MVSKYHGLEICVFSHRENFDRLEAVAGLDAYQILNYQFLSKAHHFLLPDFWRIQERDFKIRNFLIRCLGNMIRWFIQFSKLCPSGHQGLFSNGSIVKGSVYQGGFITNNDHQFFHESRYSKTWNRFSFFAFHFF